jgi:hypothetical protein
VSNKREEDYPDMYGTSPRIIGLIMFIATALFPYAVYSVDGFVPLLGYVTPGIYSFFWVMAFNFIGFVFLYPVGVILGIPSLLYVVWMVRYYGGKTSRSSAIIMGGISILIPLLVPLFTTNLEIVGLYAGPLPIQFAIGLIILYKIEGPELQTPWEGQPLSESWWKRPRYKYEMKDSSVDQGKSPEEREEDWLE